MKIKTEQTELFPELVSLKETVKNGRCLICNRKIKNGKIGSKCRSVTKQKIKSLIKLLEELDN